MDIKWIQWFRTAPQEGNYFVSERKLRSGCHWWVKQLQRPRAALMKGFTLPSFCRTCSILGVPLSEQRKCFFNPYWGQSSVKNNLRIIFVYGTKLLEKQCFFLQWLPKQFTFIRLGGLIWVSREESSLPQFLPTVGRKFPFKWLPIPKDRGKEQWVFLQGHSYSAMPCQREQTHAVIDLTASRVAKMKLTGLKNYNLVCHSLTNCVW